MIPSATATTVDQALQIALEIGYPVIVRPAYTLGGTGGGIADTPEELSSIARNGLDLSPITQVLIEKCVSGWKEIEFETMRDAAGNVIAVCSMENFDPVGIHTGDSIVVAPALTLADKEYQMLRSAALDIITALGIVGGCNCQFALNPESFEYAVIEVNPRVSRSSALASKATGYPIAKISTRLALGYTLDEIPNDITGKTCACFEPALDYVVVKLPKWPFDKFPHASRRLGTQMKATGEVMAIAPSFEMALMKAVRGAEISLDSLNLASPDPRPLRTRLLDQDDHRLFTVFEALKQGMTPEEIHELTKIDLFFLRKLEGLAAFELRIAGSSRAARITPWPSVWATPTPPCAASPAPSSRRRPPSPTRWWTPAPPSLTPRRPISTPPVMNSVNPAAFRAAGSPWSWFWAPDPSASARASSLTTARSTASGPCGRWATTWSS